MNSLGLRGSGNAKVKQKGSGGKDMEHVSIPLEMVDELTMELYTTFTNASTGNEQSVILANYLNDLSPENSNFMYFLALVWFYSNSTHSFKAYLSRFVSKHEMVQIQFLDSLEKIFSIEINGIEERPHRYYDVLGNVLCCLHTTLTRQLYPKMANLLIGLVNHSFAYCCSQLKGNPSPKEKNDMYELAQSSVGATIHLLTKPGSLTPEEIISKCRPLVANLLWLIHNDDVPTDCKYAGCILYLHFYMREFGEQEWSHVLGHPRMTEEMKQLTKEGLTQVLMFAAVVAVVSLNQLMHTYVRDMPAILLLTESVTKYGKNNIEEPSFALYVTRTVGFLCGMLLEIDHVELSVIMSELLKSYLWLHLDSHFDSVRFAAIESFGLLVKHAAAFYKNGHMAMLNNFVVLILMLRNRSRAYFTCLTQVVKEVGSDIVLRKTPHLIDHLIESLKQQDVRSSASTTLEAVFERDEDACAVHLYEKWLEPLLRPMTIDNTDPAVIKILSNLIAHISKKHNHVVGFAITKITSSMFITEELKLSRASLKRVLVVLCAARKVSAITETEGSYCRKDWKRFIEYDVLRNAAISLFDDVRHLAISLITETPKTTELLIHEDFELILHFLKYNMNTQSPVFRQQLLAHVKKFMKRVEDTHKVILREQHLFQYKFGLEKFVERLCELCIDNLVVGANYSRRSVALQCLLWAQNIPLEGFIPMGKMNFVQQLYVGFDDTYENNRALTLQVLNNCPDDIFADDSLAEMLSLERILKQASCIKPTECVSAAYKLKLIKIKVPQYIAPDLHNSKIPEAATYYLIKKLLSHLSYEAATARQSMLVAAVRAPMYGIVHCVAKMLTDINYKAIAESDKWTKLIQKLIRISFQIIEVVGRVVNNSSPEGHLPMDFNPCLLHLPEMSVEDNETPTPSTDYNNMTAQRVLLFAWRSVKEVSLLLSQIASEFVIKEESEDGTVGNITQMDLMQMGNVFTALLTETKHRGAFEQAYVGFTKLLFRLWSCQTEALHTLPSSWLSKLMCDIFLGGNQQVCGTRRSAGLPFMIQALVTVDVQVSSNPACFKYCMDTLLGIVQQPNEAQTERDIENRVHSMNILRTLFTHAALANAVAKYVCRGMIAAISGFTRSSWAERNSATLLLSALMVRVFGVPRSREQDKLCIRNKMTGRIFFLKYPEMYDFMLNELSLRNSTPIFRQSLFPVLLVLSRLYPSSLEGTTSNLKLVEYIPLVERCANCPIMLVRRLAATAIVPLVPTLQYEKYINETFDILSQPDHTMNYYHGKLIQLVKLMENVPAELRKSMYDNTERLGSLLWVLGCKVPCYLIIDEYLKVVNLCMRNFPHYFKQETIIQINSYLQELLHYTMNDRMAGRDVCLANAMSVHLNIYASIRNIDLKEILLKAFNYNSYEVRLAVLNYALVLFGEIGEESMNPFERFWKQLTSKMSLNKELLEHHDYVPSLCAIVKDDKHPQCQQRALKLLSMSAGSQPAMLQAKFGMATITDTCVISLLIECIQMEHESLTHIYLKCLLKFVASKLPSDELNAQILLNVIRIMFECSTSDNNDDMRQAVVNFLNESNMLHIYLLCVNDGSMEPVDEFEMKATLWAIIAMLLEDENERIRVKMADVLNVVALGVAHDVGASVCAEHLVERLGAQNVAYSPQLLLALALVDFRVQVCLGDKDDIVTEGRVFDQNEKYNVFMEEAILSKRCIIKLREIIPANELPLRNKVVAILNDNIVRPTFVRLCSHNLNIFEMLLTGQEIGDHVVYNSKIDIVFNMIQC